MEMRVSGNRGALQKAVISFGAFQGALIVTRGPDSFFSFLFLGLQLLRWFDLFCSPGSNPITLTAH